MGADGTVEWFRWVGAPTTAELTELTHTIAQRVGRFLQRQGLPECDGEQSYLAAEAVDEGSMAPLLAYSMMCREARMPRSAGMRKSGHLPHCRRAAKCSPYKPCRPARSPSMTRWWVRWQGFHSVHPCTSPLRGSLRLCKSAILPICRCMPVSLPRPINARSWNGCVATSVALRCQRSGCRSRRMATFATT